MRFRGVCSAHCGCRRSDDLLVVFGRVQDLLLRAKHLFVAAIDGWGSPGLRELANQNMTAGPVAFGAGAILKGPAKQSADAENAAAEGNELTG